MNVFYVGLAAFGGGVVSGLLGYIKAGEPFEPKKFMPTFLRSLLAGGTIAISYPLIQELGLGTAIVGGFLAGAGFDDVWHRLAGTIKK